ncbi:MAG: alpha/beta hydrolase [Dehalococcoidia bacterium]
MPQQGVYNPEAQYEIAVSDVEMRHDGETSWLARIYQPRGKGPFPILLDIHGGAWHSQDRLFDEPFLTPLAASGLLVVAVDFRLAPAHPYPAQVTDVNHAIRWVKAHASEWNGDPSTLGAVGTSSGGHTALLNSMRPKDPRYTAWPLPEAPDVDAGLRYVILNSAVIDPYARYLYAQRDGIDRLVMATENYFPNEPDMHEGNPQEILDRGEPVELVPVQIIHGTADLNVPDEIPERFVETYRAAGGHIEIEIFPGMRHVFIRDSGPEPERAVEAIKRFIARQLSIESTARD